MPREMDLIDISQVSEKQANFSAANAYSAGMPSYVLVSLNRICQCNQFLKEDEELAGKLTSAVLNSLSYQRNDPNIRAMLQIMATWTREEIVENINNMEYNNDYYKNHPLEHRSEIRTLNFDPEDPQNDLHAEPYQEEYLSRLNEQRDEFLNMEIDDEESPKQEEEEKKEEEDPSGDPTKDPLYEMIKTAEEGEEEDRKEESEEEDPENEGEVEQDEDEDDRFKEENEELEDLDKQMLEFTIKESQEIKEEEVPEGLFDDDDGNEEKKPADMPTAAITPQSSASASSAYVPLPEPKAAAPLAVTPLAAAPTEVGMTPTSPTTPLAPYARSTTTYGTTEMPPQQDESQMQ